MDVVLIEKGKVTQSHKSNSIIFKFEGAPTLLNAGALGLIHDESGWYKIIMMNKEVELHSDNYHVIANQLQCLNAIAKKGYNKIYEKGMMIPPSIGHDEVGSLSQKDALSKMSSRIWQATVTKSLSRQQPWHPTRAP